MFAATNFHYRRLPDESYSRQKRLGWLYPSDRIGMRFSVVHESLDGTFEACGPMMLMSVHRVRPEAIGAPAN
jgi:hypothetical protein